MLRNPVGRCAEEVYFGASVDGGQTFLPPDGAVHGQAWSGDYAD
jgi:hypothetical protein